jgi:hypothetical protein
MDFSKLQVSDDAVEMQLYNPVDGTKLDGVVLQVIGQDSQEYRDAARSILQSAIKKAPKGDITKLGAGDDEYYSAKLKALHIKGWAGIEQDGKPLEYSKENALELVKKYPWLRDQIDAFVGDRANFIKG